MSIIKKKHYKEKMDKYSNNKPIKSFPYRSSNRINSNDNK